MIRQALRVMILAAVVCSLSGCGLGNRIYGTTWSAELERMPDRVCVQKAVAAMDSVWRVEAKDDRLEVFLKWPGHTGPELAALDARVDAELKKAGGRGYMHLPEITLGFSDTPRGSRFRMDYMGWLKPDDYRELAARAIVDSVATACHLPALSQGAREDHASEPAPYLFGI